MLYLAILFCAWIAQIEGQAHHLKFRVPSSNANNSPCILITDEFSQNYRGFYKGDGLKYSVKPAISSPDHLSIVHGENEDKIVEVYARKYGEAQAFMQSFCKSTEKVQPLPTPSGSSRRAEPEIRKIVDGGDQRNRIDVVFMGDGYTASEREQFFNDMQRLTQEMFEGSTFRSYLPVFNIWAIYVESQESGIGYNGPKNTPFRLYRESGQLRGIFPGNSQYARQVCALTNISGCDYPSIIGNDDFYGGLGGEFVISTKSERTGTVVLRHEMGHNFADVGEEYDDGSVYSGVNSARTLASLGWTSWLAKEKREERAMYRLLEYPWSDLSRGPRSFTFSSDGKYSRWYLEVTVSAAGEDNSLEFLLDGEVLPWKSSGFDDREFYGWSGNEGFTAGAHNFTVRAKTASTHPDIPRMICSISLHEYGTEEEFVMSPNHVSAYPTWDAWRVKRYRPTNEGCLMRNMTHDRFCPVCQEGIWSQFLEQISIIDGVRVSDDTSSDGTREVTVDTLKLGHLRAPGNEVPGESLEVKWIRNNQEQPSLKDQFTIQAEPGNWAVEVHFNTPEVRYDPWNLLTSTMTFIVPS